MNSRNKKNSRLAGIGVAAPRNEEEYEREMQAICEEQLAQIGARIHCKSKLLATVFDELAQDVYSAMVLKGFWEGPQDNFSSKTALVHSELSEMLEANRKSIESDDKIPDFTGEEAEAADTSIRLLDMAGRYNWRLGEAIVAKMLFNLTRPYKHGKAY